MQSTKSLHIALLTSQLFAMEKQDNCLPWSLLTWFVDEHYLANKSNKFAPLLAQHIESACNSLNLWPWNGGMTFGIKLANMMGTSVWMLLNQAGISLGVSNRWCSVCLETWYDEGGGQSVHVVKTSDEISTLFDRLIVYAKTVSAAMLRRWLRWCHFAKGLRPPLKDNTGSTIGRDL